jgi:hypothetical protein
MLRERRIATWTLVTFGVLLVVAVVIAGITSQHESALDRATAPARSDVDRKVVLKNVAFEVRRVRRVERVRRSSGSASRTDVGTAAVLVTVDVAFENVGKDPATAFVSDSSFLGGDGKTYDLDAGGATIANLQSGASGRGTFVFGVSPSAVLGGRLLLTDCGAPLLDVPQQRCAVAELDLGLG